MFEVYFPIVLVLALAVINAVGMVVLSHVLGKRRMTKAKGIAYECGVVPETDARARIPVKYYIVALLFIIFDLETVFLFPWAIIYKNLGLFGLIEMGIFILILFVGYFYILKKGALQWE
ncbi:MAG: NADH-quinone oxidoreductase subunit A [candidate division Zixibacteria bacterium]|nr:NADH-quinone oxidoreductase subunit A [candidate division Zixibacteria bacterium]